MNHLFYFYRRGWRGVNIEPMLESYLSYILYRDQDLTLNIGISDCDEEQVFYEF